MDSAKLILTESVSPPDPLGQLDLSKLNSATEAEKEKFAKDFESVLLNKLLGEMQNSIGDWGLEKSGAFKQVQGLFSMFLAQEVAGKGGIGLWKDIYGYLNNANEVNAAKNPLDAEI